jgi:hypothetical protein
LLGKLIAVVNRYREEYREWAREATYRRGMALAGPGALTYRQYRVVYDRLAAQFSVGSGLWDPLREGDAPPNAFVARLSAFRDEVGVTAIQRILRERGIRQVFKLDELGMGYSFDVERVLDPALPYDCYWTSTSVDWLIYQSQDDAVAFAGARLVPQVKRLWPQWDRHLWP